MDAGDSRRSSPERAGSFSSIRESDSALAQTFTHTKVSSYIADADEVAVEDEPPESGNMVDVQYFPQITHRDSNLGGNWFPADGFKGWKSINVKGKLASKSFGDLQTLDGAWNRGRLPPKKDGPKARTPGDSLVEKLPIEILNSIIGLLVLDLPPNGDRRNVDLVSLLLTSKTIHTATLNSLYHKITIPHSKIFHKFLTHIKAHPALGTMVRRLDFSHLNPDLLFSTASERSQAQYLTKDTLLQCLELTPHLQEFLAQDKVDVDINVAVLRKLFFGLQRLQAIDFCGSTSTLFTNEFTEVAKSADWPERLPQLKRVSLHKCERLPSLVFDVLLPKLTTVTHLDVAGTRITEDALDSIPRTASITHLNLAKCKSLKADRVISFLKEHPAVQELQFLSLGTDAKTHQLLDEDALTELIPILPKTLKSLSLKGSRMNKSHLKLLLPLTKYLEELALGRSLKFLDVQELFMPSEEADLEEQLAWVPHSIKYLDLSDMWGNEVESSMLFNDSLLLKQVTEPLSVVEFEAKVFNRIKNSKGALTRWGWRTSEISARSWLVRMSSDGGDDGSRSWKMGARYWGMRKIPVAVSEVGGIYGSFMFGRNL